MSVLPVPNLPALLRTRVDGTLQSLSAGVQAPAPAGARLPKATPPSASGYGPTEIRASGEGSRVICGNAGGRWATASLLIRLLGNALPLQYETRREAASKVPRGLGPPPAQRTI